MQAIILGNGRFSLAYQTKIKESKILCTPRLNSEVMCSMQMYAKRNTIYEIKFLYTSDPLYHWFLTLVPADLTV